MECVMRFPSIPIESDHIPQHAPAVTTIRSLQHFPKSDHRKCSSCVDTSDWLEAKTFCLARPITIVQSNQNSNLNRHTYPPIFRNDIPVHFQACMTLKHDEHLKWRIFSSWVAYVTYVAGPGFIQYVTKSHAIQMLDGIRHWTALTLKSNYIRGIDTLIVNLIWPPLYWLCF